LLLLATFWSVNAGIVYRAAASAQAAFYVLAVIGFLSRGMWWGRAPCFYIPFFYCLANAAALVALTRLMIGTRVEAWQPQRHEGRP
jgi:hypothetical protein